VVGVVVVVVLCFVKSRNGLLVLLWFFFLESNTLTGSLVVLPVLVCASLRSFLSGYHQEEPVTFCCVVDFFWVLLVRQDRYLAVLIWEEILSCPTGGVAFPSFCSKGKGL
jgi:hypothetical protein